MMTLPDTMCGVLLKGFGGLDQLEYRTDIATPLPASDEVVIRVAAAGVNNTDINTRTGWYNTSVTDGTTAEGGAEGYGIDDASMGDWSVDIRFPWIQGADVVGRIVATGSAVGRARIGERVICDPYIIDPAKADGWMQAGFLGASRDGGFAQFCAVPARNVHTLGSAVSLSDEQLTTLPCSGGTAMNMLLRADVGKGDVMLVTGASGGVGSLLIQLGKFLGATVVAVASPSKHEALRGIGANAVVDRNEEDLAAAARAACGSDFSVIADVVGGAQFRQYLALLRRGGRYVTAGAIAGPMVELDLRTLYLKSLSFYGSSVYRNDCFPTLLRAVDAGALNPLVHACYPLERIVDAQQAFLEKRHTGSLVLIPPE